MSRKQIRSMSELRALQAKLVATSGPKLAEDVARRVAPALSALAQQSFDAGESPYGSPFGTAANGKAIDLKESGTLRTKALSYAASGRRVRVSIGAVRYAKYHIKRGILPLQGKALPRNWQATIQRIALEEIGKALS